MANDALEEEVRARIRQLRFERGLTLAEAARRAGMATSTFSRLETGARRLMLAHLPRVAEALSVDVRELLGGGDAAADPAPARDGKVWWPLTHERPGGIRAYRIRLPAELVEPSLGSHEGHVWMLVLEGRLRLVTQDSDLVLGPGEGIAFNTWIPHWVGVVAGPVDVLAVFSPTGAEIRFAPPPR
jgi:transcriptional regulator with XRE-family HTH domain